MYCSRECQTANWEKHKGNCVAIRQMRQFDRAYGQEGILKSSEMDHWDLRWCDTLARYALMTMNLPNQPVDRLATHV